MKTLRYILAWFNLSFVVALGAEPVGIFENHHPIGPWPSRGTASYDIESGTYTLVSEIESHRSDSGLYYAYSPISGSFRLRAHVYFKNAAGNSPGAVVGLMVTSTLELTQNFFTANIDRFQGLAGLREHSPGDSWEKVPPVVNSSKLTGDLEIIRTGNMLGLFYYDALTGERRLHSWNEMPFRDPLYAGIFAFSKPPLSHTVAAFSQVELIPIAAQSAVRTFSNWFYETDKPLTVRLSLTGEAGSVRVTEIPPKDWRIQDVSSGGIVKDGTLEWTLPSFPGSQELTYSVIPPQGNRGLAFFSGRTGVVPTGGRVQIGVPVTDGPGKQVWIDTGLAFPFWLYLPADYGSGEEKWPLLIFLHGQGASQDSIKQHGPPRLVGNSANQTALPELFKFLIVSPYISTFGWRSATLDSLLDELLAHYAIDPRRVYLTGLSMGGWGTYVWSSYSPQRFAAIAPMAASASMARLEDLVSVPVWAFHGDRDNTIPLSEGQAAVDAIRGAGGNVKFTVYPGADHERSWTLGYAEPELYHWMLQQIKVDPSQLDDWALY